MNTPSAFAPCWGPLSRPFRVPPSWNNLQGRTHMPEQDFELYLSLLSRFLRLKTAQRGEIADEMRDHLEARLEELTARGLSRGEAIAAALDEFGDAAELANHFTQVAHIRKRRLIMRVTFGGVAVFATSLLIATSFWP